MLRLGIISDLHLELDRKFAPVDAFRFSVPDTPVGASMGPSLDMLVGAVDLVLLAGDIDAKNRGVGYAQVLAGYLNVPVLYVVGNHEFYGNHIGLIAELRREASQCGDVHVLDNDRLDFELDGKHVVVLGATLWTDFELFGEARRQEAMEAGEEQMSDYQLIRAGPPTRKLMPADTMTLHDQSRAWIEHEMSTIDSDAIAIVLTHHAPSIRSIAPGKERELISAAYASNLEGLIEAHPPALWVHGHTHWPVSYRIHGTRVVSHPFGYPHERMVSAPMILSL